MSDNVTPDDTSRSNVATTVEAQKRAFFKNISGLLETIFRRNNRSNSTLYICPLDRKNGQKKRLPWQFLLIIFMARSSVSPVNTRRIQTGIQPLLL